VFDALFFHSGDGMHRVFLRRVTVQRWADAQKKLERVTEIFSVVTIEAVLAIIDRKLGAECDPIRRSPPSPSGMATMHPLPISKAGSVTSS
jgi:hypothetical protein